MCQRIMKIVAGIDINDETLALDVIHSVGSSGHYMTHEHTLKHMRSLSPSQLFDMGSRERWKKEMDSKDITERAYEKVRDIIKNHKPMPLMDGAAETMSAIIEEYETTIKHQRGKIQGKNKKEGPAR